MRQEPTAAALEIAAANTDLQADLACKRILALKVFLSRILQRTVTEYQHYTPDEISEKFLKDDSIQLYTEVAPGLTNQPERVMLDAAENGIPNEGTVFFDVKVTGSLPEEYRTGLQLYLHLDVEAQKEYRPGYPIEKRGIYYISRLISSQLEKITAGTGYAGLQKVYSIWICLGADIPKRDQQTITRFHITKEDLVGNANTKEEDYDLMELVLVRLGDRETDDELLGMLTTLFWKKMSPQERKESLERDYGIPMTLEVKEEVSNMCSYSAAIRERAEEDGRAENRAFVILNMLRDGDSDEKIRRITDCEQSEIDAIRTKLQL